MGHPLERVVGSRIKVWTSFTERFQFYASTSIFPWGCQEKSQTLGLRAESLALAMVRKPRWPVIQGCIYLRDVDLWSLVRNLKKTSLERLIARKLEEETHEWIFHKWTQRNWREYLPRQSPWWRSCNSNGQDGLSCGCHSSSFRTLVSNGPVHRVHRMTSVGSPRSRATSEGRAVTVSAAPSSVHSHVLLGSQLGLKEMQKACSLRVSPCHPAAPTLQAWLGLALTHQPN